MLGGCGYKCSAWHRGMCVVIIMSTTSHQHVVRVRRSRRDTYHSNPITVPGRSIHIDVSSYTTHIRLIANHPAVGPAVRMTRGDDTVHIGFHRKRRVQTRTFQGAGRCGRHRRYCSAGSLELARCVVGWWTCCRSTGLTPCVRFVRQWEGPPVVQVDRPARHQIASDVTIPIPVQ